MRRDSSRERLFFLLVLAGTLLLLSALMLRHESAALPTRTFRDGFTVAEDVVRRTEIVATDKNATKVPVVEEEEAAEGAEVRTTTIKTEDGDEITIKRAATSKGNKITTISRDEKGKLTIEDTTAEEERQVEAENVSNQTQEGKKQDTQLEGIPAESPSAIYKEDTSTTVRRDEEEARETVDEEEEAGEEAVMVDSGKKVTIMQVNRSLAKVSLSGVEENADEKATR
ncbi:hypothetical protein GN244_ATG10689 [Phytophthora infestans]|uniref:Uncharacterized protein n=1 Tax=Phytophthora infestans TaxID=4787 RepID=A0A833SQD8_PHYIN|nr:hypothetical protein GN244_ATG10689 [Phytophthora infestans]KAF4136633.1 hypothetical protein GN958_ATG14178 [Phytophthora infestans]KAI9983863.1 hypothetical protein PInf_005136 [Phytophthora infestans]KAI9983870.1 hypothetical protein PInf_005143 [Phytophthora infestans]